MHLHSFCTLFFKFASGVLPWLLFILQYIPFVVWVCRQSCWCLVIKYMCICILSLQGFCKGGFGVFFILLRTAYFAWSSSSFFCLLHRDFLNGASAVAQSPAVLSTMIAFGAAACADVDFLFFWGVVGCKRPGYACGLLLSRDTLVVA